jgi:hypothetical protein
LRFYEKLLRFYEKLLPELPGVLILLLAVASDINDRFGNVNGVTLHYLTAGKGESVILLHGNAQNSDK